MQVEFSRQNFEKGSNFKCHQNPSSSSRAVPSGRTDVTKLILAFRNFANAPKKHFIIPNHDPFLSNILRSTAYCFIPPSTFYKNPFWWWFCMSRIVFGQIKQLPKAASAYDFLYFCHQNDHTFRFLASATWRVFCSFNYSSDLHCIFGSKINGLVL
jgi:hypothetical protein